MKNIKGPNLLILLIVCTLGLVIGTLIYSSNLEVYQEIKNVTASNKKDEQCFEIWTIEGAVNTAVNEEIEVYQKKYPNVKFKVKAFRSEIYKEILLNAARTNTMPDMFYTWGDEGLRQLVELNVVREITQPVEEVARTKMKANALKSYTIKDKVYGMPIFGWDTVMFCNTELFEENHVKIPTTYDELLTTVECLKEKQVIPMTIGGQDAWMASLYYMELVLDQTSERSVRNATNNSELLASKYFKDAAQQLRKLIILRPWQTYYGEDHCTEAMEYFCQGKAAMMVGGSWMSEYMQKTTIGTIKGKIKVVPFPTNTTMNHFKGVAGYSDGFSLNAKTDLKNVDIMEVFLQLNKDISDNVIKEKGLGIPVYKDQTIQKQEFEVIKQCEELFPLYNYHSAYDQIFKEEQVTLYNAALKDLIRGYITDKKFIEEITE